jgi:hypothetical protein
MPFFDNRKLVMEFDYREVHVEIFAALMGATHCDLDHDPDKKRCEICGRAIRPIRVHIITIFGNDVETMINITPLAARRIAEKMIDDVVDRLEDDGGLIDEDPPESGDTDDKSDDADGPKKPPALPPNPGDLLPPLEPPDKGSDSPRGPGTLVPSNRLARIADRMKKLGWPTKAANIIREEFKKRGK